MERTTNCRDDHPDAEGARKRPLLSVALFAGAMFAAALAPGRWAAALECDYPDPVLYLELVSVNVDGAAVDEPAEAWAELHPAGDGALRTTVRYQWSDEWDLDGGIHDPSGR